MCPFRRIFWKHQLEVGLLRLEALAVAPIVSKKRPEGITLHGGHAAVVVNVHLLAVQLDDDIPPTAAEFLNLFLRLDIDAALVPPRARPDVLFDAIGILARGLGWVSQRNRELPSLEIISAVALRGPEKPQCFSP